MNKNSDNITSTEIESAIFNAGGRFTAAQVTKALDPKQPEALRKRVERFISADEEIFHNSK